MKTFMKAFLGVVLALLIAGPPQIAEAQTATTQTTLNADLAGGSANNQVVLLSTTGITASTASAQTFLYIAGEQMQIQAVNTTSNVATVKRAIRGLAMPHLATEVVWFGTPGTWTSNNGNTSGVFVGNTPVGRCTRAGDQFLPVINPNTGDISDCILSPPVGTPTAANGTVARWSSFNITQQVQARPYKKLAVSATTYTALLSDQTIGYNTNVNGTITLPALTGFVGKEYFIQQEITGTQSLTIATSAGQTINGAASIIIGGSTSFTGIRIYTDGVNWFAAKAP